MDDARAGLTIDRRFRGPPDSGNGGYVCGSLAAHLGAEVVEVTLRAPPPLDAPLEVVADGAQRRLMQGDRLLAEARPAELADNDVPAPVGFEHAAAAVAGFPAREDHPYPTCFVCGTGRAAGDGLRLHPGPVDGRRVVAAPFVVADDLVAADGRLALPFAWAALDCPSWYGHLAFATDRPPILLGRLTARIDGRPSAGAACVVIGWPVAREGRKISTGSALFDGSGQRLGHARATWIVLR